MILTIRYRRKEEIAMASQKEIAGKLKLSQATVSRALSDDHSLPLATKLKVKQLALELGYQPRRYRGSREVAEELNRSNRLLALVYHTPTLDGKYYSLLIEMIQGFIEAATRHRLTLIVKEIENLEAAKAVADEYCNNTLGAIAVLRYPEEIINLFCDRFPCVSLNHRYENLKIQVVEPQQELAFAKMYHYLYRHGHRNIGFLTVKNSYQFALSRYAGYLEAAHGLGNPYRNEWSINTRPDRQLEIAEVAELVARYFREDGVDAYLCTSGNYAKQLIATLQHHGLRVPEDISLAAFDDILTPTADGHLLCGARADYQDLADMAIRMLRHREVFAGAAVVTCETDFHRGNTVLELPAAPR